MSTQGVNWVAAHGTEGKSPLAHAGGSSKPRIALEPPGPARALRAPRSRSGLGVLDRLKSLGDSPVSQPRRWYWVPIVGPHGV